MTDNVAPQDEQNAENPLPVNMPGSQLKKARERKQLSTREVSEQLNLKHSFVVMMEEDNFDALPGATFVRGYLRAYGKLVEIDHESLVDAFNSTLGDEDKPEDRYKPIETIRPQRSFSDPLIKYTTLAVIAALIALSIMWWQSRNGDEPLSLTQSDTVTLETSKGETIVAQMDLTGAEETALTGDSILSDEVISEAADLTAEETTTGEPVDAGNEAAAEEETVERTASAEAPTEIADAPTLTPEEIGESVEGAEQFVMTFSEECWVEVTDGRGIKVVSNLKQAGESSVVEGLPPFQLMIGNAGGAEVVYQDQRVDLKPHTNRNNIARFTLGE